MIGPNGAGKTTLFRMIAGEEQPGRRRAARRRDRRSSPTSTRRAPTSTRTNTVWKEISGGRDTIELGKREVNSRQYVSWFNFRGSDQQKRVGELSGGERNRVHLAKLLRSGGNLLLLDEPTNDLDVDTLRALEEALLDFAGCAVVISHDRWFLDRIATHILAFEGDSQVTWFEGTYEEYADWVRETPRRRGARAAPDPVQAARPPGRLIWSCVGRRGAGNVGVSRVKRGDAVSEGLFAPQNRKWLTLGAVVPGLFMIMLDNTVVNVALPSIQRDLGIGADELIWVVNAYALVFGVLLLSGGKLADLFGRRRIFIAGLALFSLSSLACGLANSSGTLIGARAVQGIGAALMNPATLSIIATAFPPRERGKAIGIWAGISAMALAIGPLVGGLLTEHASWSWIFFINVPIGALGIVAARLFIDESRDTSREQRLDLPDSSPRRSGSSG